MLGRISRGPVLVCLSLILAALAAYATYPLWRRGTSSQAVARLLRGGDSAAGTPAPAGSGDSEASVAQTSNESTSDWMPGAAHDEEAVVDIDEDEDEDTEEDEDVVGDPSSNVTAKDALNMSRLELQGTALLRSSTSQSSNCLYKKARAVFYPKKNGKRAQRRWVPGFTEYEHKDLKVKSPKKFATDCSGFVSWAIKFGKCGKTVYKALQAKAKQERIKADGFYRALTSSSKKWRQLAVVGQLQRGDILVSKIRNKYRPGGDGDTGHIMILMGTPTPDGSTKCTLNKKKSRFTRYKMTIADSTKRHHFGPDTRAKGGCKAGGKHAKRFNKVPGGCGLGVGVVYGYADSHGTLRALALYPEGHVPLCPPQYNVDRHRYAMGRILR